MAWISARSCEPRSGRRRTRVRAVTGKFDMGLASAPSGTLKSTRMKISDRPVVARSAGDWEVTLVANERSGAALYVQIAQAVVADIRRGRLTPGQRLPGTRTLAERLGVHRNTVLSAYAELRAEGWIESDPARQT